MKRLTLLAMAVTLATLLLPGCVGGLNLGGGTKTVEQPPTTGQQLIDLKRARDAGAISEQEYEAQKAKLLQGERVPGK